MNRYQYLIRSIARFSTPKDCPYCGSNQNKVVDRKFIVTTLNECSECRLMFRHPTDTVKFNREFYQKDYEQEDGITTDLPSDSELESLVKKNFFDSPKDFSKVIGTLKSVLVRPPAKVIDYGANWGYTSLQFKKAGFEVESFEISLPRAKFGKKLGIEIFTDESTLTNNANLFFNSHVIEHLPDIKHMFLLAKKLLDNDGYFVAYCPNGSSAYREKHPEGFHRLWGQVHPNYLSDAFFSQAFRNIPYLIGSDLSGKSEIEKWDGNTQKILNVSGNELFVFAKIKNQVF